MFSTFGGRGAIQKKCITVSDVAKSKALADFFASDEVALVREERLDEKQEELPEDLEVSFYLCVKQLGVV